jgi:hypothetical protein
MDRRRCAYCGVALSEETATEDHVIARSWFPEGENVPKWKVPSCRLCNNTYSKMEREALGKLAMCLNPRDPRTASISGSARRSISVDAGKNDRDREARRSRRRKVQSEAMDLRDIDSPGVLPFSKENFRSGSRTGIRISAQDLDSVVTKWARGILYAEMGIIVPPDYGVEAYHLEDAVVAEAFKDVMQHARQMTRGWGVEVLFWYGEEGGAFGALFVFNIWDKFRPCCSIQSPDVEEAEG